MTSTYPLGRSADETERLMTFAAVRRMSIVRFVEDVGIEEGMKVLDLGCGAGDLSLIVAEKVGPQGSVLGIDANPDVLATARRRAEDGSLGNVTFENRTIPDQISSLPRDFDAVLGRLVLCYIPEPAAVLESLIGHTRAGAVFGFAEFDWTVWAQRSFPRCEYHEQLIDLQYKGFEAGGTDMTMGTNLYDAFVNAGLPAPTMRAEVVLSDASTAAPFITSLLMSLKPTLLDHHLATESDLDRVSIEERLRAEAKASPFVTTSGFQVMAWSRRSH